MKSLQRTLSLALVLVSALFVNGCGSLLSVEPLATEDNTIFNHALLGIWSVQDESNNDLVYVRAGEQHSYDILWVDMKNNETYHLQGWLVQIGGRRILDVTAHDHNGPLSIPGHAFVDINLLESRLQLQFLDSQWLQERAQQSELLPHSQVEGHPVITGTTAQIQDFILQFGLDDQARSEPVMLQRVE